MMLTIRIGRVDIITGPVPPDTAVVVTVSESRWFGGTKVSVKTSDQKVNIAVAT
jgi:hypothetical protein